MKAFALPDLGEGLHEAEIVAWHVSVGDHVVADQPLVSVETEKAVVEIPAPWSGRIAKLQGQPGDRVTIGTTLVEYEETTASDAGTVVGALPKGETITPAAGAEVAGERVSTGTKATPAVRALARKPNFSSEKVSVRPTSRTSFAGPLGFRRVLRVRIVGHSVRVWISEAAMKPNRKAFVRVGVPLLLLAAALLPLACTVPVRNWRTGESVDRPLPLVRGGPHVDRPSRVWIDTDAACNGGDADPDDCFAILILMNSPDAQIVGISTVFGNAPLSVVDRTTRDLVGRVVGSSDILVHSGSSTALEAEGTSSIEPAHAALERALERGPLTIVCLGPLTNVAATLRRRPDLAGNVGLLVSVMGRRPGHVFHPAEGRSSRGIFFGHGPIFRDFNFSKDRTSAAIVLGLAERISLTPYAAAREVMVTRGDLARMKGGPRAAAWVADRAGPWLDYWERDIGPSGFYPFDGLAALYVLHPQQFSCAKASAWIAEDDRLPVLWRVALGSIGLLVGLESDRPRITRASGSVTYCGAVGDGLKDLLMDLLTKTGP